MHSLPCHQRSTSQVMTGFTLQFGPTLAACRCIKAVLPSQRCADTCSGENGQQSALCMQDSIYSINVSLKLMKKVNWVL